MYEWPSIKYQIMTILDVPAYTFEFQIWALHARLSWWSNSTLFSPHFFLGNIFMVFYFHRWYMNSVVAAHGNNSHDIFHFSLRYIIARRRLSDFIKLYIFFVCLVCDFMRRRVKKMRGVKEKMCPINLKMKKSYLL